MVRRRLGRTELLVSPIGFGAFKIGRNEGIKYPHAYDLPDDRAVTELLNGSLDMGINLIDTAPAYGLSEQRIGQAIGHRRGEYVLSTKVGEEFEDGRSKHDYSAAAVEASIARSRLRLRTDVIDLVFVHSDGRDLEIQNRTDVITTLTKLRERGEVRGIGFSGKTIEGMRAALGWADAIMVEFHPDEASMRPIIDEAAAANVGVVVKKGLGSGRIPAEQAIRFVLGPEGVGSIVIGSLSLEHMRRNVALAATM